MALEDARMEQPLLESTRDVRTNQPPADKGFGFSFAAERKAATEKVKEKKASERMERNVTHRAVTTTGGDVDFTAPALARPPAKRVFLKKVGPLVRRRVLNTILKDFFKPSTPVSRENDMKMVDAVLTDLPRVTRSEPTAAIPPKLEDMWM